MLYNKLVKSVNIRLKHCKRVSTLLLKHNLVPKFWLHKPKIQTKVNFVQGGKMLAVSINKIKSNAILDTGSSFTLIPYFVWEKLKLTPNMLDTSVLYNIKSASYRNLDPF